MKKLFLSLSLFLSFSSLVHAQWTTNGANTITSTTNSVGIGTTAPSQVLDVTGTGGAFSATGKANAAFLQDHTNYRGINLGYDSSGQIGIIGSSTPGVPSNLAFWNYGGTGWFEAMRLTSNGYLGIGTTNPQTSLHVVGTGATYEADNSKAISGGGLVIQGNIGGSRSAATGAQLEFVLPANPDGTNFWGQARIITVPGTASPGAVGKMILGTRRNINKFGTGYQLYYGDDLIIDGAGNIGIGMINPQNKLDVRGKIHSQSVVVDMLGWSDYVLKKDYQLPSLQEVKAYIDQNQHLPEIPSEQQIAKEGLNLGEMNKLLMKKVEELTLYLIEKDKNEKEQIEINNTLKSKLKAQQEQIDRLAETVNGLIHN